MTKLYRLRPLEWVEHHFYRSAKTPWGEYRVHYDEIEGDFFWTDPGLLKFHKCQSYEDGQSAAEAHYRARMAEGLVEVEMSSLPYRVKINGCEVAGFGSGWSRDRYMASLVTTPESVIERVDPPSTRAAAEAAKKEPTQ